MAKIKTGGIVISVDGDGKVRRLRRVYTDAVGPNASVADENELADATKKAAAISDRDDNVDGALLEPWPEE